MIERRIHQNHLKAEETAPHLKAIAGLIQRLTYSEMTQLTGLMMQEFGDLPPYAAEKLLKISEILLTKDTK